MSSFSALATLDRRYLVVLGACLIQFMVIGLLFCYGVFFKSLETEFGWSRTLLSSSMSFAFLVMGVLAMFGGRLNDRYGPRLLLSITGVMCGLGFIVMAIMTEPWHLFVALGLLVGAGLGTHDVVTLSTTARWFERRRGIMTGVVKVGTAAGQVVLPPLAAFLIAVYDWRLALLIMGLVGTFVLVFAAILMTNPPPKLGIDRLSVEPGLTFAQARRSSTLWKICAIEFVFLPALTTVPLHIVVHATDLGMRTAVAAMLLSVIGATSVFGRLAIGTLFDRIGGKRSMIFCFVPLIVSLAALLLISTPWLLFGAVAVYGFAHGGLFTVVSPTVAEYFGLREHGSIFGAALLSGTIGGAAGPILAGMAFDVTGSYEIAFVTLTAMAAAGLLIVLRLPSAGEWH